MSTSGEAGAAQGVGERALGFGLGTASAAAPVPPLAAARGLLAARVLLATPGALALATAGPLPLAAALTSTARAAA